ncbi:MAG: dockerin type I repeat-containing protein [Planctomycetota bacterium]
MTSTCGSQSMPGVLGTPGQNAWDFNVIHQNQLSCIVTHDFVAPATGGFGGDTLFPGADFAQHTQGSGTPLGYRYFSNDVAGRTYYGLYQPGFSHQPEAIFPSPAIDYPSSFTLGSSWNFSYQLDRLINFMGSVTPSRNLVTTTAICDAWGTMTLPNLGTVSCLRVMDLEVVDFLIDPTGLGVFVSVGLFERRSYKWFAPGLGQIARVRSLQSVSCPISTPPLDFSNEVWEFRVQIANSIAPAGDWVRGDANADGTYNIADAVYTLTALFGMGPQTCEIAMDANDDNTVNIADSVFSLSALFGGGAAPPSPHPSCGSDGNPGALTCGAFPACP